MQIKNFYLLLVLLLTFSACHLPQRTGENIQFIILQMNDVYEIAPLEGGKAGGLARVATVRKELLKETPNVLTVLSGDFLSPSFIGTLKTEEGEKIAGLQMVETLNSLGLDYVTFGNHEFDISDPLLLEKRINQSRFRYTVCNASYLKEGKEQAFTQRVNGQDIPIPEYIIHHFSNASGDELKVGFLGVLLPFNKQKYVRYRPVTEAFRQTYKELKGKVDICIGITHLSIKSDMELAKEVPGIPLFLGGHDHTHMNHYVENTIITKADANAKTVYIHRITYNPSSKMMRIRSSLKKIDAGIEEEAATRAVVQKWQAKVNGIMAQMGYHPDRQVFMAKEPLVCTEAKIRSSPSNYGKLTVSAFESVLPGADVYLVNSGSMRLDDDILGTLTEYDVLRTFPFGGGIVSMELPGNVLKEVLQAGLVKNVGEGGFFQIIYVEGKNGRWLVRGKELDDSQQYKVVLPEFVAKGREANLSILANYEFDHRESFDVKGGRVKNDIRDIVIWSMAHK